MVTISPLTKASVETTADPTVAPVLSMTWKEVPAYVPEQPMGTG